MTRERIALIGIVFIFLSIQTANAQKEKYHSIFIYNFSKYIKWPENQITEKFVIGVFGDSPIIKDLSNMAAAKKEVNGMPFEIQQYYTTAEIGDCQILYVPRGKSAELPNIISILQHKSVLVITDKSGMTKEGSVINFVNIDGKIRFELNQSNAELRGLKVAASLLSLAILE